MSRKRNRQLWIQFISIIILQLNPLISFSICRPRDKKGEYFPNSFIIPKRMTHREWASRQITSSRWSWPKRRHNSSFSWEFNPFMPILFSFLNYNYFNSISLSLSASFQFPVPDSWWIWIVFVSSFLLTWTMTLAEFVLEHRVFCGDRGEICFGSELLMYVDFVRRSVCSCE